MKIIPISDNMNNVEYDDYIDPERFEQSATYMEYHIIKEVEKYFPNGLKYRIKKK